MQNNSESDTSNSSAEHELFKGSLLILFFLDYNVIVRFDDGWLDTEVEAREFLLSHFNLKLVEFVKQLILALISHVSEVLLALCILGHHVVELVLEFRDVVDVGLFVEVLDHVLGVLDAGYHAHVEVRRLNHHLLLLHHHQLPIQLRQLLLLHLHLLHRQQRPARVARFLLLNRLRL